MTPALDLVHEASLFCSLALEPRGYYDCEPCWSSTLKPEDTLGVLRETCHKEINKRNYNEIWFFLHLL